MLGGLWHRALVGGDDQQGGVDAAHAGQHVLDEALVARHVDDADPRRRPAASARRSRGRWSWPAPFPRAGGRGRFRSASAPASTCRGRRGPPCRRRTTARPDRGHPAPVSLARSWLSPWNRIGEGDRDHGSHGGRRVVFRQGSRRHGCHSRPSERVCIEPTSTNRNGAAPDLDALDGAWTACHAGEELAGTANLRSLLDADSASHGTRP